MKFLLGYVVRGFADIATVVGLNGAIPKKREGTPFACEQSVGIQSHEDLVVWQLAMRLAVQVQDDVIVKLPLCEKYELASQLRRSSTSIPFNIAEGWARPTRVYINHLGIALGSEAELKTQLKLALRKRYVTEGQIAPLLSMASEVGRMMNGLTKSLERRLRRDP